MFAVSRRLQWAVAGGVAVGATLLLGFGPLVRYEAGRAAARYGAELEIERVVPTWHGARLVGVHVALAEIPSARVELGEVEVVYGVGGRRVALRSGLLRAVGPREELVRQVEAWRASHESSEPHGGPSTGSSGVELEGITLAWQDAADAPTEALSASDVHVSRAGGVLDLAAATASLQLGHASVTATRGHVRLERREGHYHLTAVEAEGIDAALSLPSPRGDSAFAGGTTEAAARPSRAALRGAVVRAAAALDATLDPGLAIRLHGVRARLRRGDDTLGVGPGTFSLVRSDDAMTIELAPEVQPGHDEQALTFRAVVPLHEHEGAPRPIALDVQGGPIWLSTLGLHDGDFGLFDVARSSLTTHAHVVLSADGASIDVSGDGKIHALSIRSDALSEEPVAGLELAWRGNANAALDGSRISIDDGELDLGAIKVIASGTYEKDKESIRVKGSFELPLTGCQQMFDSAPKGLKSKIDGMRFAGSFALKGKTSFDTKNLDRFFELTWDSSNTCRVVEAPPAIDVARFRFPFKHTAYDANGGKIEVESGPGAPGWVPLDNASHFMPVALMSTEDGGFLHHHGFDAEAIKNSIRENIRKRKFVRGASTLTMQLAKNLYLDRTKNLARKLQEAVLTMYLEQELTKEQILELYLNVVEFAPDVYGIGPAAMHYFNTTAGDLSLGQSLYIASVLPNPKMQHWNAGGAVSDSWMSYLRKLMRQAHKRNRLNDDELEEGLRETVVRGVPQPRLAAKPIDDGDGPVMDGPDFVAP